MHSLVSRIQQSPASKNTSFDCGGGRSDSTKCRLLFQPQTPNSKKNEGEQTLLASFLRAHWEAALRGWNLEASKKEEWFQRLWALHCQNDRFYHTAVHLEEMLHYLMIVLDHKTQQEKGKQEDVPKNDPYKLHVEAADVQVILLSIFFHDAIYNAQSATNESDSVALFREFVHDSGTNNNAPLADPVETFILATKQHQVSPNNPAALALFLDLDMAVLGKELDAYLVYAAMIRKEYEFVPAKTYCEKRAQVLQTFLTKPIFGTQCFGEALEERARHNLQTEIEMLQCDQIPGNPPAR